MEQTRQSGILMHISSLPGAHGIGELGRPAEWFVDFLQRTKQRVWQVLPLTPPARGNSPYASLSAFAGNPLLISLPRLVDDGLLTPGDLRDAPIFSAEHVDYERAGQFKVEMLRRSYERFCGSGSPDIHARFSSFVNRHRWWLDDFALFQALFETHQGTRWNLWKQDVVRRKSVALDECRQRLATRIQQIEYDQFLFFAQWQALKAYTNERGIQILGDVPIFMAYESADVWSHQEMFLLDADGAPTVVAGVPPDYFSKTGQLWGNPLYDWRTLESNGFQWWVRRIEHSLSLFDMVRIDHFRGFHSYWEVPAGAETAIDGRWVEGPGERLFRRLREHLGRLPLVAEDLGMISPGVHQLREQLGLPGMRVLQFAFGEEEGAEYHRPYCYPRHCVVYTGTHDNDTSVGWFRGGTDTGNPRNELLLTYLGTSGEQIHWDLIRLALSSVANLAIIPLQDVLGLDNAARMNLPGTAENNWTWRVQEKMIRPEIERQLRELTEIYGRAHQ